MPSVEYLRGKIKLLDVDRNKNSYGLISCPGISEIYHRDVWFNKPVAGTRYPRVGMDVDFTLELDEKGQPRASEILLHTSSSTTSSPSDEGGAFLRGVIKEVSPAGAHITCETYKGQVVFINARHVDVLAKLGKGDHVKFKVQLNKHNRPEAIEVKIEQQTPSTVCIAIEPPHNKKRFYGSISRKHGNIVVLESDDLDERFPDREIFVEDEEEVEVGGDEEIPVKSLPVGTAVSFRVCKGRRFDARCLELVSQ